MKDELKLSSPVILSYIVLGLASGILLREVGYTAFEVGLMSLIVYSGSGQFMIASMTGMGAAIGATLMTVLFLDIRMILLSASISEFVKHKPPFFLFFFGATLTDESYGLNYQRFQEGGWTPTNALRVNFLNHFTWIWSNILGALLAGSLNIDTSIMSFAIIALFISLTVSQFVSRIYLITGILALTLTVLINILINSSLSIVLGTLLAATAGYYLDKHFSKRKLNHV